MKRTILRWMRRILLTLAVFILLAAVSIGSLWLYLHPHVDRINAIVYGHRGGRDLAFDVVKPSQPNRRGIILVMSGGWRSPKPGSFDVWMAAPILHRGYTVFPVYHISQPDASVMEITEDILRSIRFIRHHAHEYGVDPDHLGISGGSAGGHLSLMVATTGGPGNPDAADPIERESSAVQAVAIFYPPTDLINLGTSTENLHDDGPPKSFKASFGPDGTNSAVWHVVGRQVSPIFHVHPNMPPILIYHGNADTLVPLDQSERFLKEAREQGNTIQLVVHAGGGHGWATMPVDEIAFADWYDRYLKP